MGRYVNWDDIIDRYPELNTLGGADQISSTYIVYAETFVDASLASHFSVPFSQEIMLIKDLTIDTAYWRAGRFKLENATEVKSSVYETLSMLKNGQLTLVDEFGIEVPAVQITTGIYSTTQSYTLPLGMDDPIEWAIDEDQVTDTTNERD